MLVDWCSTFRRISAIAPTRAPDHYYKQKMPLTKRLSLFRSAGWDYDALLYVLVTKKRRVRVLATRK